MSSVPNLVEIMTRGDKGVVMLPKSTVASRLREAHTTTKYKERSWPHNNRRLDCNKVVLEELQDGTAIKYLRDTLENLDKLDFEEAALMRTRQHNSSKIGGLQRELIELNAKFRTELTELKQEREDLKQILPSQMQDVDNLTARNEHLTGALMDKRAELQAKERAWAGKLEALSSSASHMRRRLRNVYESAGEMNKNSAALATIILGRKSL